MRRQRGDGLRGAVFVNLVKYDLHNDNQGLHVGPH